MTDNTLERICSVALAIILLFLLPMSYISMEKRLLERNYLEQRVHAYGELVSTTGVIDPESWLQLKQLLPMVELRVVIIRKQYFPGQEKGSSWEAFEEISWEWIDFKMEQKEAVRLIAGDAMVLCALDRHGQEMLRVWVPIRFGG